MRQTEEWLQQYLSKFAGKGKRVVIADDNEADPGLESTLAGKIMKYAKDHAFPCQCFRKSKKAKKFLVPGWPD